MQARPMVTAILLMSLVSLSVHAEDHSFQDFYENGKKIAQENNSKVFSSLQEFKPESIFNNFTDHPAESDNYGGVQQKEDPIKVKAREEAEVNPLARTLKDNYENRPQYKIDPNADNLKNSKWFIDNSDDLTHNQSCKQVPVCDTTYENTQCQEQASIRWHYCQKVLRVNVANQVHETHYPITVHLDSERYYIGAVIDVTNGRVIDHGPHDSKAWMDGRLPANVDCNTLQSTITQTTINKNAIDGLSFPSCGSLRINIHITLSKNRKVRGKVTIDVVSRKVDTNIKDSWDNGCLKFSGDNRCKLDAEQCTQGRETRIIGGIHITRDCWAKDVRYACQSQSSLPNTCEPLRQQGCEQVGSICHTYAGGECLLYDQTFRCPLKTCSTQTICTEKMPCINGDCTGHTKVNDPDFNQAVGSFGAMVEAGKQMDKNNHFIFQGKEASCSKAPIGFLDCCADSGWGEELNFKCSEEEKKLKESKDNHLTISIPGDYCVHEVGGICTSARKRYCVFPTKLARLIQDKGRREQLHIDFGTPKDPKCTGIMPEDLQRIDFSKIDFSEIAEDIKNAMPSRDQEAFSERIKQRVQEMGQKNG